MENSKNSWFKIGRKAATGILIYHLITLILSATMIAVIIIPETNPLVSKSIFTTAVILSILTGFLGACIFYSRKLYKSCISLDMMRPVDEDDKIRQLGIIYYYCTRPFYASILSMIVCIATMSGAEFVTTNGTVNPQFPYFACILSFFIGYSSGDFLDYLEDRGRTIVQGVFNGKSK